MKKFWATIGFFTRIPVWRFVDIPSDKYKRVVDLWPLAGWITGGVTALVLWGALYVLPPFAAVVLAYASRLIFTGALHEDGLADFIDGMGGGTNKERILAIMKDSHIGSYGVIGLIIYFLLLTSLVASLPIAIAPLAVLAADAWGKFCGSLIVDFLPYARTAEQAKNKLVYDPSSFPTILLAFIFGILPSFLLPLPYLFALILPAVIGMLMLVYLRHKIGGYTGDCCGASALLCELTCLLSITIITKIVFL